jgi:hypothetical protein
VSALNIQGLGTSRFCLTSKTVCWCSRAWPPTHTVGAYEHCKGWGEGTLRFDYGLIRARPLWGRETLKFPFRLFHLFCFHKRASITSVWLPWQRECRWAGAPACAGETVLRLLCDHQMIACPGVGTPAIGVPVPHVAVCVAGLQISQLFRLDGWAQRDGTVLYAWN